MHRLIPARRSFLASAARSSLVPSFGSTVSKPGPHSHRHCSGGAVEQRHEVQVGEILLLEVRILSASFWREPGKQVGVHGHAEHVAALVPIRVLFAGLVETLQVGRTVSIGPAPCCRRESKASWSLYRLMKSRSSSSL